MTPIATGHRSAPRWQADMHAVHGCMHTCQFCPPLRPFPTTRQRLHAAACEAEHPQSRAPHPSTYLLPQFNTHPAATPTHTRNQGYTQQVTDIPPPRVATARARLPRSPHAHRQRRISSASVPRSSPARMTARPGTPRPQLIQGDRCAAHTASAAGYTVPQPRRLHDRL